ncbi:MAG TPA: 3-oxoacyl-[acyl-carrier-protein] reductase [Candidatus Dormibacteraeota bacterium]
MSAMRVFSSEQVALVTGGGRGIGRAVAFELARSGASVAITWVNNELAAKEVVAELESEGHVAAMYYADIGDESSVRSLFQRLRSEFGRLDILVNNAGITADGLLMLMSTAKWQRVLRTNLDGAFLVTREAMRLMARARTGTIVNVASVSGIAGVPGQANYSAAKAGVIALTKAIAREGAGYGIRVNAVAPGLIDTEMLASIPEAIRSLYVESVPMKRIGTADEVAHAVAFLASDRASYITGQTLIIDGGMVAH